MDMETTAPALPTLPAPPDMSAQIDRIADALAKAQAQIRAAAKDRENPHLRTRYATLASVWDAAREALTSNGLSVTQPSSFSMEKKTVLVVTVLLHPSGQWIRNELELPVAQATPQGIGSVITYARRYALSAVVGIAPDDETEDDGTGTPSASTQAASSQPAARALISAEQRKQLQALCEETGTDEESFAKWVSGGKSLAELPAIEFNRSLTALQRKASAQAAAKTKE